MIYNAYDTGREGTEGRRDMEIEGTEGRRDDGVAPGITLAGVLMQGKIFRYRALGNAPRAIQSGLLMTRGCRLAHLR
jgi:hypothetical protein